MTRNGIALASGALLLGACMGTAPIAATASARIRAGEAQLLTDTVTATTLTVSSLVAIGDERVTISVRVQECSAHYGTPLFSTFSDGSRIVSRPAYYRGAEARDRLFTALCDAGMPLAAQEERAWRQRRATMTPEEREEERRKSELLLRVLTGGRL